MLIFNLTFNNINKHLNNALEFLNFVNKSIKDYYSQALILVYISFNFVVK
jgi:hypothetical protein